MSLQLIRLIYALIQLYSIRGYTPGLHMWHENSIPFCDSLKTLLTEIRLNDRDVVRLMTRVHSKLGHVRHFLKKTCMYDTDPIEISTLLYIHCYLKMKEIVSEISQVRNNMFVKFY